MANSRGEAPVSSWPDRLPAAAARCSRSTAPPNAFAGILEGASRRRRFRGNWRVPLRVTHFGSGAGPPAPGRPTSPSKLRSAWTSDSACAAEPSAPGGVQQLELLDLPQISLRLLHRQVWPDGLGFSAQVPQHRQARHAGQRMHQDLAGGPAEHRVPARPMAASQSPEHLLHVLQPGKVLHHLLRTPVQAAPH